MSLPDTIFIFVLALIIFGPKRLPEIGRQIGKLVGEFRKASNEFKFQIEEELRQAELADRRKAAPVIAPPADASAPSAAPGQELTATPAAGEDLPTPQPAGQHPNPEYLAEVSLQAPSASETTGAAEAENAPLMVASAAGSQPRTVHPFAPPSPAAEAASSDSSNPAAPAEITHG